MSSEINVVALVKGQERYVFLFDDDNRVETLRQIGRYAANPELSFTWYDAAVMSQKIRQTAQSSSTSAGNIIPMSSWTPSSPRFQLSPQDDSGADWFDTGEAA